MTDDRWEQVKDIIKNQFTIEDVYKEDIDETQGGGYVEAIEFQGPLGLMKVQRSVRPKVDGKKTLYSRRAGSSTSVEYTYSQTETVKKFEAFTFDDATQDWVKIENLKFFDA